MKPFFSVIIPTFNRAKELKRAVESVLVQSFCDFEILVMDDGSSDDTQQVILAINDTRIIYEWEKNYGGPARPRNRGIVKAKGEWICFLDADDAWLPDKLQVCVQHINKSVDLIYHDLKVVGLPTSLFKNNITKSRCLIAPVIIDLLINDNAISNSSVVVRKIILDKIGQINEDLEMIASEDYNTWLRIALITNNFLYIPKVLGLYSVNDSNISSRDMSCPVECARKDYLHLISEYQNKKYMFKVKYATGRRAFKEKEYLKAQYNFEYSFGYADLAVKLKSLYMLIVIKLIKLIKSHSGSKWF